MIRYKLTTQENKTHNDTVWGENVTHKAPGTGELCSSGWIHVYSDPRLAVLLNPIHANIKNPKIWECKVEGKYRKDKGLKEGWQIVTTLKELELPVFTTEQKVKFAILCAKEVYKDKKWNTWADKWLSGENKSKKSAYAAAADDAAAYAAAAYAAAGAADAAAYAAAAYAADVAAAADVEINFISIINQL